MRDPDRSDLVLSLLRNDNPAVAEGALRAVAMLKLPLTERLWKPSLLMP